MTLPQGVAPALAAALERRGYEQLTPVQSAMLDDTLTGRDLLVSAQTGSGKTVAFGLAATSNILDDDTGEADKSRAPQALIIAPTRELALQVKQELIWLYADTGAFIASCVGGMSYREEIRALERGAQIVVGTPGRLVDHVNRGTLDLSELGVVVLDEADEMLDLGFREELETLLSKAPDKRRTLMFSATVSTGIQRLAENFQQDAARVNLVADTPQHTDIDYRVHTIAPADLENAVFNILRYHDAQNSIVFCSTRANVNHLTARLANRGVSAVALSGELSQKERSHALQAMRDGRARVCVATDVAARGIDLPGLQLVVHADLPRNAEALLHRSGRTGRAGRKGVSTLLASRRAVRRVTRLLEEAGIDEAEWTPPPNADDIRAQDEERLLADKVFIEPVNPEEEADLIKRLLDLHGPEKVAAAFLRVRRESMAPAEDLTDPGQARSNRSDRPRRDDDAPDRGPRKPRPVREDFKNGQWIRLTIGRRAKAEPRWLLPMLCKAGGLERKDIGAIRIADKDTFVELSPGAADKFIAAVGPDALLEKSINVSLCDKPGDDDFGSAEPARKARPPKDREKFEQPRGRTPKRPRKVAPVSDKPDTYAPDKDESYDSLPRSFKDRLDKKRVSKGAGDEDKSKPAKTAKKKSSKSSVPKGMKRSVARAKAANGRRGRKN